MSRRQDAAAAGGSDTVVRDGGAGGVFAAPYLPVTVAILTTIALAAFDALAIVAALPAIGADLGSVGLLPWVITGFLVTSTIAVVVAGPIIDAFGVRATFRVTLVGFVASSALCAAAPTMPLLVAGRVVQGFGGGLVVAVCFAAVGVAYPGRLTAKAFAAESAVWGLAGFGGPAVASVLVSVWGWPSVFLLNVPLGLVAAVFGWRAFPGRVEGARALRLDTRGVALLAGFVVVSLVGVGTIGVWTLPALAAGAVLAVAYWWHAGRVEEPVLARRHVVGAGYLRYNAMAFVAMAAGLGADSYLPLYLRGARGTSESFAAFSVLWLSVGWTLGSFVTSWFLDRAGERRLLWGGTVLLLGALAGGAVLVAAEAPIPFVLAAFLLIGLGVGTVTSSVLTQVQRSSDAAEIGRANAAHQFFRNLGITFGVALGGAALLFVVGGRVDDLDAVRDLLAGEEGGAVDPATAEAVAAGFVAALTACAVVLVAGAAATAATVRRRAAR
ncbi:MAG: MFS transporter [Acidimicrobiales bacterium]|nr:MFS transporter [Acidimicrobiales bacterium]